MVTFFELGRLGRLGNQLFQYAALRSLALERGYESKIPDPKTCTWHGQTSLLGELNIESSYLSQQDVGHIRHHYREPDYMNYHEYFYTVPDNTNISGFFQSIYYFKNHQDQIKKELTPKEVHMEKARQVIEDLRGQHDAEIVSLHLRRGDNTDNTDPNQVELNNFYNEGGPYYEYLANALNQFEGKKVKFLVFTGGKRWTDDNSEDVKWCKEHLVGEHFLFSEGKSTLEDFSLIVSCDHNILSHVSSFGWWAAYLNSNPDKIVVAPQKYHPDCPQIDYRPGFYPEEWILV